MNEPTTKCNQQKKAEPRQWNEEKEKEEEEKQMFAAKLNGFRSVCSFIWCLVCLLSHFRDYINFRCTIKWMREWEKKGRPDQMRNFATCMRILPIFNMCMREHIVHLNQKFKGREREQEGEFGCAAFACCIRSLTFLGDVLGCISKSVTKEMAQVLHCTVRRREHNMVCMHCFSIHMCVCRPQF